MNKTDPFLTYRPVDSDVEAEWTPERSTRVLEHVLSSANGTRGSQRFTATKKKAWAVSPVATAGVAAAAVAVVVTLSGSPSKSPQTTPDTVGPIPTANHSISAEPGSGVIVLAGYKLAFPADYKTGKVDTNCTSDLHLSADEQQRLITTPSGGCPLLVTSVRRDLPSGAVYTGYNLCINDDGDIAATFTGAYDVRGPYDVKTGSGETFLPAKLPDGSTVYVTIDDRSLGYHLDKAVPIGASKEELLSIGPSCGTLTTQLTELAKGMDVTPAS